jgi:hypothetical protein
VYQEDERDDLKPTVGREQPQSVHIGGYQQHQPSRHAADEHAGDALRSDERALLEARLHRDDGRDRHPVAVRRRERSEGERHGAAHDERAEHREHDQRPGQLTPCRVTGEFDEQRRRVMASEDQPREERHRDP